MTKNKILFHDSNRKRILLFCCLIFILIALCLISFNFYQYDFFLHQKNFLNNDSGHVFKDHQKEDELYKLIGEYEYCDRINGPYIKCLNGGVCVKIDCYISKLKYWNSCFKCICLKVSHLILK